MKETEVIQKLIKHMVIFLKKIINNNSNIQLLQEWDDWANTSPNELKVFIKREIKSKENDLDSVINFIFLSCKIEKNEIEGKHINKFKRYLEAICEVLN